jgi:hypothetical protein
MLELRRMKWLIVRQATLGNMVYNTQQSVYRDVLPIAKQRMVNKWQKSWEVAKTGKFAHSIFPMVSLRPWFEEWSTERKLITTVSRIIAGHCGVRKGSALLMEARVCVSRGSWDCRPYNMEMLPFFVPKSMSDSEVITVWRLWGDPNTRLVLLNWIGRLLKSVFCFSLNVASKCDCLFC